MSKRLTYKAFGELIGYSEREVNRLVANKQLTPDRKPGGRPFFTQRHVDEWKKLVENKGGRQDGI